MFPLCLSWQPYYSTRVIAADIDSRMRQLDQTTQQQQDGDKEKSKAGFWEEFDVSFNLDVLYYDCFPPECFLQGPKPSPAYVTVSEN